MCAASDEVMVMKYRTVKKKKNYTVTKESFPNKAEKDEFTFTLTRNKKQKTEKKKIQTLFIFIFFVKLLHNTTI